MSTNEVHADNPQRLTWEEICRQFPDKWVVLADGDWFDEDDEKEFGAGSAEVIAHHARRRDASPDMKAALAAGRDVGCFWTGRIRAPLPCCIP